MDPVQLSPESFRLRSRAPNLIALIAAGGAIFYLWYGWCVFPLSNWNELRLAPAFALRHGFPLYPPAEGGPLSTWIYGPLGAILMLPATTASSASGAILAAGALNLAVLFAPLIWLCLRAPSLRALGWPAQLAAIAVGILLTQPRALVFYVADHVAIACGLLSCWCLAQHSASHRGFSLTGAALWCVLAITAKQTAIFLPAIQLWFLFGVQRDRSAAARYAGWLTGIGVAAAALAMVWFGAGNLRLNVIDIPRLLPWGDPAEKALTRYPQLLAYTLVPLILIIAGRRHWRVQSSDTIETRFLRCTILVFLGLLPIGLLSFLKVGGDLNTLNSWSYLLPAALLVFIPRLWRPGRTQWLWLLIVAAVALRVPQFMRMPTAPLTLHLAHAQQIAREGRRSTWFPNNPLVTFYTDGLLYHVEDGIATRHLAGFGLRETAFRRHLPAGLNRVVYSTEYDAPFALQLLDFKARHIEARWAIYTR